MTTAGDVPATDRLDRVLVSRELASSRNRAAQLIAAGSVQVDGRPVTKASQQITAEQLVQVTCTDSWASRASHKLIGALDDLGWSRVPPRVLDAGASTGGFTHVLLSRGAEQVYAVDVGHGQLVDFLRADGRVRVRERLNLRDLTLDDMDGRSVDLVVADVSFISLRLLLPPLLSVLGEQGSALLMVKPQFEVGREALGSGGVVHSEQQRLAAVADVVADAEVLGWVLVRQLPSRLPGPAGNVEYFIQLIRAAEADGERPALG